MRPSITATVLNPVGAIGVAPSRRPSIRWHMNPASQVELVALDVQHEEISRVRVDQDREL